jgi:hypothetical protein
LLIHNFLDLAHQGPAVVRFWQEPAVARNHLLADAMTGGENNSDARPALADTSRQAQAIEGARHFDVREQIRNASSPLRASKTSKPASARRSAPVTRTKGSSSTMRTTQRGFTVFACIAL